MIDHFTWYNSRQAPRQAEPSPRMPEGLFLALLEGQNLSRCYCTRVFFYFTGLGADGIGAWRLLSGSYSSQYVPAVLMPTTSWCDWHSIYTAWESVARQPNFFTGSIVLVLLLAAATAAPTHAAANDLIGTYTPATTCLFAGMITDEHELEGGLGLLTR